MIKTKTWILIFTVLAGVCLLCTLLISYFIPQGPVVQILQDGTCIREIDLSRVASPFELTVEDIHGGRNVLRIEPGRICIKEADCPDQICVHRGWLKDGSAPIVCLPHRLVIQAVGGSGPDAVVG